MADLTGVVDSGVSKAPSESELLLDETRPDLSQRFRDDYHDQ